MPKRNLIWILAAVIAAAVTVWVARREHPGPGRSQRGEFAPVEDAYELIKKEYYRPVRGRELQDGAVGGMVSKLDEFSSYVTEEKLEAFSHRIMGVDRGLGLRLESVDGRIIVVGPLANSPAHKAGILAGDVIIAVDAAKVTGLSLERVEKMLVGPVGQEVAITLVRHGDEQMVVKVTRAEYPIQSVQGLYRDGAGNWVYLIDAEEGIACLRVREFVNGTAGQVKAALAQLEGMRGLILDLRDNPGGMLPEAVATANLFLREGPIATCRGRRREPKTYNAQHAGTMPEVPIVVLINAKTCSAAEIVAGAMKLHDRAVIVGTRSRGKGAVQTMFRLPGRLGQINLTTSELLIGRDRPINRTPGSEVWGVDPHDGQEVIIPPDDLAELAKLRVRAEVLPASALPEPATRPAKITGPPMPPADELVKLDRQLQRAVELLRRPAQVDEILARARRKRARDRRLTGRRAVIGDE